MVASAHRVEQSLAAEFWGEQAGQAAVSAEQRRAGMTCPMAALVAVGVRHDADAIALFERVLDQPFEGAPVGMNFDAALDARIVAHLDVGVATADVCEHDAILVLQRAE